jgi:hypothetical protein
LCAESVPDRPSSIDIKRYLSKRLDRIDMQQPAGLMHDVSDFATG